MKCAVYPGSFDPVTLGHMDIIKRASSLFDRLIIAVLNNRAKTPLFSVEERVKMLEEVTKDLPNVEVKSFGGMTVDFARECGANALVRSGYRYGFPYDKLKIRLFKLQLRQGGGGLRRGYFPLCYPLCRE